MNDTAICETLLVELHAAIDDAAAGAVAQLGPASPVSGGMLAYPPTSGTPHFTNEEAAALAGLNLTPVLRAAMQKLIADAGAAVVFRLLCLLDGVADPEVVPSPDWLGASIQAPGDEHRDMLHDAFFDAYWQYRAQRPQPSEGEGWPTSG